MTSLDLGFYKKLLQEGYSLCTLGKDKVANFSWKPLQTKALTPEEFEKYYSYKGGSYYNNKEGERIDILPTESIALICGYNDVEVLDIDLKVLETKRERDEFWHDFLNFCDANIDNFYSKFVIKQTLNKGYHILYRSKLVEGNKKIATPQGKKEAIIETRGLKGYVVMYPNTYEKGGLDYHQIQEISDLDREILHSIAKSYNYIEEAVVLPKRVQQSYEEGVLKCWDDYNQKTDIFDIIKDSFDVVRSFRDKIVIRRIGSKNVSSGSIFSNNCIYIFTSGTIYPQGKLITPFVAYAFKYHHGDLSAAAKDLYQQGFGSRIVKKKQVIVEVIEERAKQIAFPISIFPAPIQNYMIECNRTLDSSLDYLGCSFLWLLSTCVGNSCRVKVKNGWEEPAGVWISVVGRAGLGKTPAIHNIINPLLKKNSKELKNYLERRKEFEAYEKLSKDEKSRTVEIKEPKRSQFIVNDVTLEALVELCQESDNAVGVFKDELAGWLKDMNKYRAGSDLEFWLSTWSSKTVTITRKTSKNAHVDSPLIPVIGGIQPDILSGFYTEENKANGFMDRLLLCNPELEVEKYNDNEMPGQLITDYNDLILSFYDTIKLELVKRDEHMEIQPNIIPFSTEAKTEWIRIFNALTDVQNDDSENEYLKSMLPKQKSYIPRFALLLEVFYTFIHSIENDYSLTTATIEISKTAILNAEKLSNYFIDTAKKIQITARETQAVKKSMQQSKATTPYERFCDIYTSNPNANKKQLAEMLEISRTTLYSFIEKITKENEA